MIYCEHFRGVCLREIRSNPEYKYRKTTHIKYMKKVTAKLKYAQTLHRKS